MESRLEGAPFAASGPETDEGVSGGPHWEWLRERRGEGKPKEPLLGPVTFPCETGARPTPAGEAQVWPVA